MDRLPFLYLTGLTDFTLSEVELEGLRRYLLDGGYLLINNSLGLSEFDNAVRREVKRLFPQGELKRLPADHALYSEGPFKVSEVQYSLPTKSRFPDLNGPLLEAVEIANQPRLIYSPFDLAAGWQGDEHPLAYTVQPGSALQLGANLITWYLTH